MTDDRLLPYKVTISGGEPGCDYFRVGAWTQIERSRETGETTISVGYIAPEMDVVALFAPFAHIRVVGGPRGYVAQTVAALLPLATPLFEFSTRCDVESSLIMTMLPRLTRLEAVSVTGDVELLLRAIPAYPNLKRVDLGLEDDRVVGTVGAEPH